MKSLRCHPSTRPVSPGTSVSSRGAQPSSDGASSHYQIYSWTRQLRKRMSPIHLCDFLPHPKSALWGHPSGFLVQLSHVPSPIPSPFAPSCCSPRLSGPRTLTAGIFPHRSSRAPPTRETCPYFGAPLFRIPAHQHRGVILEQRVCRGNHGGDAGRSPAAAPQVCALFAVTMETSSPFLVAWAGLRSGAGPAVVSFRSALAKNSPCALRYQGSRSPGRLDTFGNGQNRSWSPCAASCSQFE